MNGSHLIVNGVSHIASLIAISVYYLLYLMLAIIGTCSIIALFWPLVAAIYHGSFVYLLVYIPAYALMCFIDGLAESIFSLQSWLKTKSLYL